MLNVVHEVSRPARLRPLTTTMVLDFFLQTNHTRGISYQRTVNAVKKSAPYADFALCTEMLRTVEMVAAFDPRAVQAIAPQASNVLLTGEGSSRIFPAKRLIADALRNGYGQHIITENATQAIEYDLAKYHIYVASNSGKTAEGVHLIRDARARAAAPRAISGVVANAGTPIAVEADSCLVLGCGKEQAVAATISVVEQALVYDALFRAANKRPAPDCTALSFGLRQVLSAAIDPAIIEAVVAADVLYFAGRNDGVAEELTLKTNEITRKRSDYLEGTYAVHGIEEVMAADQLVVVIEPFPSQEEKFAQVLEAGVGMKVIAIASRPTRFPTIRIPADAEYGTYLSLAAGWSLLVEAALALGVNLDRPQRARKVGNEFVG